jgi:hypothetical protein
VKQAKQEKPAAKVQQKQEEPADDSDDSEEDMPMQQNEAADDSEDEDDDKDAEIQALRKLLMVEHKERLAQEKLAALNKAQENPGSITKEKKKKMKRKGRR